MTCILFRRILISLAYRINSTERGCNLFVWYGFSDENKRNDLIIDASIIKSYLETDLSQYDHACISIDSSIDSADDIVSFMVYLGNKIFKTACSHDKFSHLRIENEYGDVVLITNQRVKIFKHFVRTNEKAYFSSSNDSLFSFINSNPKHCVLCGNTNYTDSQLNELLFGTHFDRGVEITYIDDISATSMTFQRDNTSYPVRLSVSCRGQYAHQINAFPSSKKCSHLHGHTYTCCVSALSSLDTNKVYEFILTLGRSMVTALNEAFQPGYVQQTTVESVARYISNKLSQTYKLVFIELTETPNIMVRLEY